RAVFPGEQGGPHVNTFAAMALAFKLAQSSHFVELQKSIVANAGKLAASLEKGGLRLAFGGTDTHMLNVDLRT
ncbi:MAG: serine hydroxymethyltransferase, partial [candidate division Zixibacteria bacterium]|nr:serine hydroxymethyltransferase [candidate division Zixibacteria bacterium]NIS45760.1 serine hydroxymethyltransferase [candidate division Zixibacteria bacterium]NIU13880.1 serine hydroxymethyltransferase [candidate division Zixibacteria bacterium]NIV05930.1 serine hydroxymethyltransferase [candidate division Zixibacteria bacterium]NIW44700.1 serine hydroxymethyltransferase [Gammaproteobacteria bacterium]